MDKVSEYRKLQLTLNIMPKGQGILHMLSKASGARMAHINGIIAELFEMTQMEVDLFLKNVEGAVKFEIPLLRNVTGRTALDICLKIKQKEGNELFPEANKLCKTPKVFLDELKSQENAKVLKSARSNIMLAGMIMENVADFGMMHSSPLVTDALIVAVR